jgi:ribosomal protein S18 acetylase RimI-like enzyme
MAVDVRKATSADYPGVARVAREVHEHHVAVVPDVFRSVEVAVSEETYAALLADADCEVFLAEREGEVAGYAVMFHRRAAHDFLVPRTFAHIDNFGVAEAHRRAGVGQRLFATCAAAAKARGAIQLELDCWEANREAVSFYAAMGMRLKRRRLALDL